MLCRCYKPRQWLDLNISGTQCLPPRQRRWCDSIGSGVDCYGNPVLRLSKVSEQSDAVKNIYRRNRSLRAVNDYYDVITSEMIIKRIPPPVIPFCDPGVVVGNSVEYGPDTKFVVKWPEYAN